MSTIAYLNGRFLPLEDARLSPLDRGFLFGDGVYEVIPVYHNKLFCLEEHLDRLNQSLAGIRIAPPHTHTEWKTILETLVEKNQAAVQTLYLQVTRGADVTREHQFPKQIPVTIFAMSHERLVRPKSEQAKGIRVTGVQDIRWKHAFIKTTSRVAYVLMNQEAKEQGFDEGIILNDGFALEGTTSNIFMVREGVIITPPKSSNLLSGITRDRILRIAEKNKIPYQEAKIPEQDLLTADELWITSSARGVFPVVEYSGHPVGNGTAGPVWNKIWDLYVADFTNLSVSIFH